MELVDAEFSANYFIPDVTAGTLQRRVGRYFFPEDMGDKDPSLVRAFEHIGPVIQLPVWLVCHQELRTNLRVRRVFDFIADELSQAL